MWARIEQGKIVEITHIDPDGRFHHGLIWASCAMDAQIGDVIGDVSVALAEVKAIKLAEIEAAYAAAIAVIAAQYPDSERDSWPKQEAEARAYTANPAAPTPLLSAIAFRRGITVTDLAARVIANADAYAVLGGDIIGRRQARMDAIAAAVTANDMDALLGVVW